MTLGDANQLPLLPQDQATELISLMFEHLADWPIKSAAAFRNAALGDQGMLALNPMLTGMATEENVKFLGKLIVNTIREGCMIDFGYIPNQVFKEESIRSRQAFEMGELPHPFERWVGVTQWEGGYNGYMFTPNLAQPGETLAVEMYGVSIPNIGDAIIIYDIISIKVNGLDDTVVTPALMRYPPGHPETTQQLKNRGSNSLDPMVTMLRFLADASIPITHEPAPEKLNKQRAKKGRWLIPAHNVVHTRDYVSALGSSHSRAEAKGGHHASPIAHWRRGHLRHLASGKVVPVKSSRVNWRDAEELHRIFYRI